MSTLIENPRGRSAVYVTSEPGYRICTYCIMDTTDPEITFDDAGCCNHCVRCRERIVNEKHIGEEGRTRLDEMVAKIKSHGRGKEYDCIIGVSGGVDSTTVAYHVKRLGLRPLALHLDNGWNSELAVDNIKQTLERLDIDLFTHVIDWEEFRDLQLSFLKASVPNCEIPTDHAINALLINTALKRGVKYVLHGGNVATEGIMPISWGYYNQDLKHLRAVHRRFGSKRLRTLPQISLYRFVSAIMVRGVKYIPILNYLDYNKQRAKDLIQSELGWRDYGGKHYESIYTRFFQGYILPTKFGIDKRRAHLSTLICSGEITRKQALEEMRLTPYREAALEQDTEYVIKKFGLTKHEFARLLEMPPQRHADYPSNELFFHQLKALKAIFKRVATRA